MMGNNSSEEEEENQSDINWLDLERILSDKIYNIVQEQVKFGDYRLKLLSQSDIFSDNETQCSSFKLDDTEQIENMIYDIMYILDEFYNQYSEKLYNDIELGNQDAIVLRSFYLKDMYFERIYKRIHNHICKHFL